MPHKHHAPRKASAALEIQQIAAELQFGEDTRVVCPYCGGGSTNERSLSISRMHKHQASYCCWRASCDLGKGKVSLLKAGGQILNGYKKDIVKERKTFYWATQDLGKKAARYLRSHFGLTDELLAYGGVSELQLDGRIVYPIFSPKRSRRGRVLRTYDYLYHGHADYSTVPKAMNFVDDPKSPATSWYYKGRHVRKQTNHLVIVEDIPSALRLNPYTDSLALCGTIFSAQRQLEVKAQKYAVVYLALDNDATKTAAKVVKKNKLTIPNLKVRFLHKDVKNMKQDELDEFVKSITDE